MARIIGLLIVAFFATNTGAQAQVAAPSQGAAAQTAPNQGAAPAASSSAQQQQSRARENEGPPYSSCYLKCINSGDPADFCQLNSKDYCY